MNQGPMQDFISKLENAIGNQNVILDEALRAFYSTDIREKREMTAAVVQPTSVDDLQSVVALCSEAKVAVVARGGGMSYSGGYAINLPSSITLDMSKLNRIVEINVTNGTATVEAGVTWRALDSALKQHGLRTPFYGPFSGEHATIGGSLAQHSLSLGSGCFGISADNVLNIDVVTGNGKLVSTGSMAGINGHNFFRYYGPDLTGLFLGDCGTLGIKARITLRLIPRYKYRSCLSFNFDTFEQIADGMAAVARLGVADCSFGNDPASLQQMMNAQDSSSASAKAIAKLVYADAPNPVLGVFRLGKLAINGQSFLKKVKYNYHVIIDGHTMSEVRGKLNLARRAARPYGNEIPNTIPTVINTSFYVSIPPPRPDRLRRGVPQHGVVPFDQTANLHNALQSVYGRYAREMDAYGVSAEAMYSTISTHAFLYEPVLTWPDTLSDFNRHYFREKFEGIEMTAEENVDGRKLVAELQNETTKVFADTGAVNFQLGKTYPYWQRLHDDSKSLLHSLKTTVDPNGILNPGALGLPTPLMAFPEGS